MEEGELLKAEERFTPDEDGEGAGGWEEDLLEVSTRTPCWLGSMGGCDRIPLQKFVQKDSSEAGVDSGRSLSQFWKPWSPELEVSFLVDGNSVEGSWEGVDILFSS